MQFMASISLDTTRRSVVCQFVRALRDQFRCVALDFPGFGLSPSDARYPAIMPDLALVVERFVETLELRDIILVVGDAGGPIGLGVA
ncbi:MAG: hypothetical protein E6I75_21825, partial [Chloroflexi bacterium]